MVIIREIAGNGAWWYKTAEDAFKDLQNEFGIQKLRDRQDFIDNMENHIAIDVGSFEVFSAYEGDQ